MFRTPALPFGTSKIIDLGMTYVRATRISYVGELGFELLVPADQAVHVYDTLTTAGEQFELMHAGYHALNSLRLEKAYRSWGHDIGWGDNPFEAGLGFTIDWDKPGGFVGRDALASIRERVFDAGCCSSPSTTQTLWPTTRNRSIETVSWSVCQPRRLMDTPSDAPLDLRGSDYDTGSIGAEMGERSDHTKFEVLRRVLRATRSRCGVL